MLKPTGRVVKSQAPLQTGPGEVMHITFVPAVGGETSFTSYPALYDAETGEFRVTGRNGRGLPPGEYRVTLQLVKERKDVFAGRFNARQTPFRFELTSSSSDLVIDLDQAGEAPAPATAPERRKRGGRR